MLWVVLLLNLAVAAAKWIWGTLIGSVAMQADGFHSVFDATSNVVGIVGISLAARPADRDHPYGHGKYETYASAAIGGMLVLAAWRVGSESIARLAGPAQPPAVDALAFAVMLGTMAVNLGVTLYERRAGRRLHSAILVADASHTGSDVLVSASVIVGLAAVRWLDMPRADSVVALIVAVAIVYTAWGVLRQASATLADSARIPSAEICDVVEAVPGVLGCHTIRTRGSESEVYVDLHIQVEPSSTVLVGHEVAELAERAVSEAFPQVVDVIAHMEPLDDYQERKTAEERDAGLV